MSMMELLIKIGLVQDPDPDSIHCSDRTIKNLIDKAYGGKPESHYDYECRVQFYVELGIKYKELMNALRDEMYCHHKSDPECDIPDYKTFLEEEKKMLSNKDAYKEKTVCVEGYVSTYFALESQMGYIVLYPIPTITRAEELIFNGLQHFHFLEDITLIFPMKSVLHSTDTDIQIDTGLHIRVHGVPYFYDTPEGENATRVHIFVHRIELLN